MADKGLGQSSSKSKRSKSKSSGRRTNVRTTIRRSSTRRKPSRKPSRSTSSSSKTSSRRTTTRPRRSVSSAGRTTRRRTTHRTTRRRVGSAARTSRPVVRRRRVATGTAVATAGVAGAAVVAGAAGESQARLDSIRREFESLQATAQLSDVYGDIGRMDSHVAELPVELNALRDRGYVHAGRLEDKIRALQRQWRTTRPRVESQLQTKIIQIDNEVSQVSHLVRRMSGRNSASLAAAESGVDGLRNQIRAAQTGISGLYSDLESELNKIDYDVRRVGRMLNLLDESAEIQLREAEGPLIAAEAEWLQDGDEGPEGYLFLTDQRLLFEQKEQVATKKFLGLFATEKETVQRLLFDVPFHEIEEVKHSEKGGFLGIGDDDLLDLVLGASAPVTRARFNLKSQESSDWASWINRVKSRDIDNDRNVQFTEEVEEAAALAQAFPSQCPNCFAPVETPPAGVLSVTCEFCGSIIKPEVNEESD